MSRKGLDELLRFISSVGSDHLGGRSAIFLVDEGGKTLRYGASCGLDAGYIQAIEGFEIGPHSPSCGTAAYTGDMVIVGDVAADQLWAPFLELANQHGIAACWSKPLMDAQGVVIGTYAIYHQELRKPTSFELEAIELLAHTAAMMIERSIADTTLQATVDALQRSEIATREVSHRVMNTLHILEGIMAAKIRSIADPQAKVVTTDALERLRSMSLVHQKLFAMTQQLHVDVDASVFLTGLVSDLRQTFVAGKNLTLSMINDEGILLTSERCASLGLLMVELVLNAIKHAFGPDHDNSTINIRFRRDGDAVLLSVSDNGKGLPEGKLAPKPKRLGAKLIESFLKDLHAEIRIRNLIEGAEFTARFPFG